MDDASPAWRDPAAPGDGMPKRPRDSAMPGGDDHPAAPPPAAGPGPKGGRAKRAGDAEQARAQEAGGQEEDGPRSPPVRPKRVAGLRVIPFLVTLVFVVVAGLLSWAVWDAYLIAPWTRDGTVRAYVVTETSEVSGRLVSLPVHADGFVTKGQLLMEIEPTDYQIAVANAEAEVEQTQASLDNARAEAKRRQELTTLSTSVEERQTYETQARTAQATLRRDLASLAQARVNLARTRITSPVNGFITNLDAQLGDYVTVGERVISIVNSDSFWVDGYFEETQLAGIRLGDRARLYLMGYKQPVWGHVAGIARGIEVQNAQPDSSGLASVNPTFTWIRLAQRIPVRIALDQVPPDILLAAGMTATVQINPHTGHGPEVLHALVPWHQTPIAPALPASEAMSPDLSPAPGPLDVPRGGAVLPQDGSRHR